MFVHTENRQAFLTELFFQLFLVAFSQIECLVMNWMDDLGELESTQIKGLI